MTLPLEHSREPYLSRYLKFIQDRLLRVRNDQLTYERHHILPVCLGGKAGFTEKANIILLTPREHYIAHLLLYKAYDDPLLACAFWQMSHSSKYPERLTSRQFSVLKEARRGWKVSPEARENIRLSAQHRGAMSAETKEKLAQAHRGKPLSPEHRKSISIATNNKSKSENAKRKMSEYSRNRSEEHRQRLITSQTGRRLTEDQKQHLREAQAIARSQNEDLQIFLKSLGERVKQKHRRAYIVFGTFEFATINEIKQKYGISSLWTFQKLVERGDIQEVENAENCEIDNGDRRRKS